MPLEPKVVCLDTPMKLMIRDLKRVTVNKSQSHPWKIQFLADSVNSCPTTIEFSQIWLQGTVKYGMNDTEIIVVTDGTGDVKVSKCSRVPGDRSWIKAGAYCGIFASANKPSSTPPEVEAIKVMDLSETQKIAENMWPVEVQDIVNFLRGTISFNL